MVALARVWAWENGKMVLRKVASSQRAFGNRASMVLIKAQIQAAERIRKGRLMQTKLFLVAFFLLTFWDPECSEKGSSPLQPKRRWTVADVSVPMRGTINLSHTLT